MRDEVIEEYLQNKAKYESDAVKAQVLTYVIKIFLILNFGTHVWWTRNSYKEIATLTFVFILTGERLRARLGLHYLCGVVQAKSGPSNFLCSHIV